MEELHKEVQEHNMVGYIESLELEEGREDCSRGPDKKADGCNLESHMEVLQMQEVG